MNTSSEELNATKVSEALQSILDPEFGLNIVELGLIYDVQVSAQTIAVTMTLTTPHCPAGNVIFDGVRACLAAIPGGREVNVELTWMPPWTPELMSRSACEQLGWADKSDV